MPGAPTFFLGDAMFYGQDRLDFVARALERPFTRRMAPIAGALPDGETR